MDRGEREAVLSLVPYFDKHRVVVDVGSNKGEWSDILIQNTDEHLLFEPNKKLLHYTEIKYAELRNVIFYPFGLSDKREKKTFYECQYQYNGLSSIYCMWEDVPYKETEKNFMRLDQREFDHIDFLKLDVEGAELLVLKGAERLLEAKKIKFIQIETGHQPTGDQITELVTKYGYKIYRYTDRFEKAKIQDCKRENLYIMQEFTEDWNQQFIKNTKGLKCNFALEIGAFEGLTSCYICDFLLKEGGRMIAVDPLQDQYLVENIDKEAEKMNSEFKMFEGQYDRFIRNTKGKPIELKRMTSRQCFALPGFDAFRFDFIYIDGDHRRRAVYEDGCNGWEVLRPGGYILFDDYQWSKDTARGINAFLKKYNGLLTILVKNYQVLIQKNVI